MAARTGISSPAHVGHNIIGAWLVPGVRIHLGPQVGEDLDKTGVLVAGHPVDVGQSGVEDDGEVVGDAVGGGGRGVTMTRMVPAMELARNEGED